VKLAIRFADKIVGVSVVLALGILVFVLFMMGVNQRWFARDYVFHTYLDSAQGLSQNMPVQHVGFNIGAVRSFEPVDNDMVRVDFVIFDTYIDRARVGSSVQLIAGPIPMLGNQFVFIPGPLESALLEEGQAIPGERGVDSIGAIISLVDSLLYVVHEALEGTERTEIGRILRDVGGTVAALERTLAGIADDIVPSIGENLEGILAQVDDVLASVGAIAQGAADPEGAVMAILDGESEVYSNLVTSLDSVAGILASLELTAEMIPSQFPQIASLLFELQDVLRTVDDVLVAVANNPLLRGGVPQRTQIGPGGTFARDIDFWGP